MHFQLRPVLCSSNLYEERFGVHLVLPSAHDCSCCMLVGIHMDTVFLKKVDAEYFCVKFHVNSRQDGFYGH
jgi:hypothetical protein